ncbi:hypothetical protein N7522_002753 [Penicillium canescens]|nr:hypothetical protein N7522_002753 [Penicillium canescens]
MDPNSKSFEQSLLNYSYARATKAPETGYTSSPESSQANEDEKDEQATLHSLPSIREVLDRNSPLPYPMPGSLPRLQLAHRPNVGQREDRRHFRVRVTTSLRVLRRLSMCPGHRSNSESHKTNPKITQTGLIVEEKSVSCVWPLPFNEGKVQWRES